MKADVSAATTQEWYLRVDDVLEGPFTERELKCKYVEREIDRETCTWSAPERRWKPFAALPFFADIPPLHAPTRDYIRDFDSCLSQGHLLLLCVGLVIDAATVALLRFIPPGGIDWEQRLFIYYVAAFNTFWFVYFMSRQGPQLFHVLTLRRLLRVTALQWNPGSRYRQTELGKSYQEKARSSTTATAMFAAVAGLELSQVNTLIQSAETLWAKSMIGLAGLAALTALICFIIAVDALDVMFNKFESHKVGHKLYRHYYMSTINPRYFGLLSLLTGAVFLVAHASPALGAAAIGLIVAIGFRHWYPPASVLEEAERGSTDVRTSRRLHELIGLTAPLVARLTLLVAPPMILYFFYQPA